MGRIIDYRGLRFAALTLLEKVRPGGRGVGAIWLARCDCGNTTEVIARDVANGRRKTCGKCKYGRDLARLGRMRTDRNSKVERQAYSRYFRTAARRRKEFTLEPAQFVDIIKGNCVACDSAAVLADTGRNEVALIVDREGYTPGNVASICRRCRDYKQDHNLQDFLDMCQDVTLTQLKDLDTPPT